MGCNFRAAVVVKLKHSWTPRAGGVLLLDGKDLAATQHDNRIPGKKSYLISEEGNSKIVVIQQPEP